MAKLKSNRGAAKRFKASGTGKIRRSKAYRRHILSCKTRKQKRGLREVPVVDPTNVRALRRLLPYL